jgi:hypothetical protein
MRSSTVSLLLLAIRCAATIGQTTPGERSATVPKIGEKGATSSSPAMLENFLKAQVSELLSRRRREVTEFQSGEYFGKY